MSTREYATTLFEKLDEEQLAVFIKIFADENEIARIETEMIINDKNKKHYNNFKEILSEIEEELENELVLALTRTGTHSDLFGL